VQLPLCSTHPHVAFGEHARSTQAAPGAHSTAAVSSRSGRTAGPQQKVCSVAGFSLHSFGRDATVCPQRSGRGRAPRSALGVKGHQILKRKAGRRGRPLSASGWPTHWGRHTQAALTQGETVDPFSAVHRHGREACRRRAKGPPLRCCGGSSTPNTLAARRARRWPDSPSGIGHQAATDRPATGYQAVSVSVAVCATPQTEATRARCVAVAAKMCSRPYAEGLE